MTDTASTQGISTDSRNSARPQGDGLRSRNSVAIALDVIFAMAALAPLLLAGSSPFAWLGVPTSLVFLVSGLVELAGTQIDGLVIRCPARIVPFVPLIAFYRCEVDMITIHGVVVQRRWLFLQRIFLECPNKRVRLLFSGRKARVAFVETIQARDPYVQVYRI